MMDKEIIVQIVKTGTLMSGTNDYSRESCTLEYVPEITAECSSLNLSLDTLVISTRLNGEFFSFDVYTNEKKWIIAENFKKPENPLKGILIIKNHYDKNGKCTIKGKILNFFCTKDKKNLVMKISDISAKQFFQIAKGLIIGISDNTLVEIYILDIHYI